MDSVLDHSSLGLERRDMYRAWVLPDEFPNEKQPRLENWHPEDLVAYCGGVYAKGCM